MEPWEITDGGQILENKKKKKSKQISAEHRRKRNLNLLRVEAAFSCIHTFEQLMFIGRTWTEGHLATIS